MTPIHRRLLTSLFAAILLAFPAIRAIAQDDALLCSEETARQERLQAVPDHLLHAISLVESGRWDAAHKANLAWPWTVMAEGEGRFLPSKQAAIAEVTKLRARGVRNIDVGCMQVNLLAHPDAFASLDDAFEPRTNIAYAARFLNDLYNQDGNWAQAGAHYHSQTPELAAPYKAHLLAVWDTVRHGGGKPTLQMAALDLGPQQHMPLGVMFPIAATDRPDAVAHVETASAVRADPLGRSEEERKAAKSAADAYRQTKLAEYMKKKNLVAGG